jgi:hypothetical protein
MFSLHVTVGSGIHSKKGVVNTKEAKKDENAP